MDRRLFRGLIGIFMLGLGLAGCASSAPIIVALPTAVPVINTSVNPLPHTLADVKETQVYRFRVDPARTTVEYAVREVLLGNDQITRGKTNAVEGEFQIYMQNGRVSIALSNLQVDLRTLSTDNTVRDQALRKNWLESDKYPKAIFVANSVAALPMDAVLGQPYSFQVSGDLTIRNITQPVTFDVTVTASEHSIAGEGTTIIKMKDFGFDPPSIVGKTIVSDPATITIKGTAELIEG